MRCSLVVLAFVLVACAPPSRADALHGALELVLLHTADTHAQLFPWPLRISGADARRGLGASGTIANVGGFARIATLVGRERARVPRVLHLDSGDLFQGSLSFDRFGGEPELLAFDALGVDAQALGNHELDRGAELVTRRYGELATFPLLASNYVAEVGEASLARVIEPFVVLNAAGLRVGVIGVGNTGSVGALHERPNALGVRARAAAGAVQGAIDVLRPLVDVIVALTHLGLDADEQLVRATSGLDLVLGGHQHLTLDAPEWVSDCAGATVLDTWGRTRVCTPRRVPIVHSGAYGKYVGRVTLALDDGGTTGAAYDPLDAHEVTGVGFELLPVHAGVGDSAPVAALLEPFRPTAAAALGADGVEAFAPAMVERIGATGADSPLGNFAAAAVREAAGADLALIGASSLRHDLPAGLVDAETRLRVLPFEDAIVRVSVPGVSLADVFERAARSASERDCRTQLHVAGALVRFRCPCAGAACARVFVTATDRSCASDEDCRDVEGACAPAGVCLLPLEAGRAYAVATTAYLAGGGSGLFAPIAAVLRRPVADSLHEAVGEALRDAPVCGSRAGTDVPNEDECTSGCAATLVARQAEACAANGSAAVCADATLICERANALCQQLPCLDEAAGAVRDGRIRFEAP